MTSLRALPFITMLGIVLCGDVALRGQSTTVGQAPSSQLEDCRRIAADLFPQESCPVILTYLGPKDQLGPVMEDGEFIVISPTPDGKTTAKTYELPPSLRSELALNVTSRTIDSIQSVVSLTPQSKYAEMLPQGRDLWSKLRDAYCYYHPQSTYIDLARIRQNCVSISSLPDQKSLDSEFDDAVVFETNFQTFVNMDTANRLTNARSAVSSNAPPPVLSTASPSPSPSTEGQLDMKPGCARNISFAVAEGGHVTSLVPDFAGKWVKKNQKKYPNTCFSQIPISQAENYVLVFARSASAFAGVYPTVRTSTQTSTSPISGSGTVTDNYGGMWNYTYNGTATTTTTTTEHLNLPYTDTSSTLYVYSYDQRGTLRSRHSREVTTRSGGDAYNTLGYNLGTLLTSVHIKEHLLSDSVKELVQTR